MNRPIHFRGGNSYLSNFYACRIRVWNREFHTVESAYQWKKCVHNNEWKTAEKMVATRSGLQAKYLSKSIREKAHLREEWNRQRYSVMYALVAVKFRDRYLRKRLLDTGESELMEWVKSKEGFWSALTYDGRAGQNMLGQILMQVREFTRTHQTVKRGSDVTRMRDCNQTPGDRASVDNSENITRCSTGIRDYNQAPGDRVLVDNSENITRCSMGNEPSKTAQ